jgi:uncharacterized membrane protein
MNREDIHIISRHSNWSVKGVNTAFKKEIYPDDRSWKKFLEILLFSLGVCFAVSGIIFFFAYNWADLHKFVKIGLVEGLIIVLTLVIVFINIKQSIKNIILTGVSVLVGAMIAVFGQIYQTGANAYDFFLGWTAFITVWVVIASYPPLWLVYLILANTTFVLYSQQVAFDWSEVFVLTMLVLFNTIILTASLFLHRLRSDLQAPKWFTNIIALAIVFFATIGICTGIFGRHQTFFVELILCTTIIYGLGLMYGFHNKSGFYIAIIPFSIIAIVSALLIKISDGATMMLLVSIFMVTGVSFLIKSLIGLQKQWNNE